LLEQLGPRAIGIDVSREELGRTPRVVQGRAQALPFADASFDACTCHLAFMLFDDVEQVVAELSRVLVPGGELLALLGGGPTADGDDAFHRFLAILAPHARDAVRFGDPRAKSEAGWRVLFAGWGPVTFERWELDLGGTFDEVWAFVGASYEVPAGVAGRIRQDLAVATQGMTDATGRIPCTAVTWLARVARSA
jgi:SAM-dependent methyltransferase